MLSDCAAVLMVAWSDCHRSCAVFQVALATSTDARKYGAAAWACYYCHSSCTFQHNLMHTYNSEVLVPKSDHVGMLLSSRLKYLLIAT